VCVTLSVEDRRLRPEVPAPVRSLPSPQPTARTTFRTEAPRPTIVSPQFHAEFRARHSDARGRVCADSERPSVTARPNRAVTWPWTRALVHDATTQLAAFCARESRVNVSHCRERGPVTLTLNYLPRPLSMALVTLHVVGCNLDSGENEGAIDAAVSTIELTSGLSLTEPDVPSPTTNAPGPSTAPSSGSLATEPLVTEPLVTDGTSTASPAESPTTGSGLVETSTPEPEESVSETTSRTSADVTDSVSPGATSEADTSRHDASTVAVWTAPTSSIAPASSAEPAVTVDHSSTNLETSALSAPYEPTDATVTVDTATSESASFETEPIDWLRPPGGPAPFGLPEEYATFDWVDVDQSLTLDSSYDETNCSRVYDDGQGGLGFIECDGDSERWGCRCYSDSQSYDWVYLPKYFVDTSANTGEACRLGAAICLTDLPRVGGYCYDSGRWDGISAQSCVRDDWCDYNLPSPHGDVRHSVLMPFIQCGVVFSSDPTAYMCGTEGAGFRIEGLLEAVPERSIYDTCDLGARVFRDGVDPGSEGAQACVPMGAVTVEVSSGEDRQCSARYQCTRPATTSSELISLVYPEQMVNCSRRGSSWSCWCNDDLTSFDGGDADGVAACNSALDECTSHPVLE
jgi:hypothetical protein